MIDTLIEIFKIIIYGIVEGITEWLPISSTGHLILLDQFMPLHTSPQFFEMFKVVIQLGAILAVIVLYFHKLNPFSSTKSKIEKQNTWQIWFKVVIATIPAVLVYKLDDIIEEHFMNYTTIAFTLILYGILFIIIETKFKRKVVTHTLEQLSYQTALLIGISQILALVPGTSRSGVTILAAILLGTSRYVATEFSFFLGIPAMFGLSALKLIKFGFHYTAFELITLVLGMSVAFIVSVIVIKSLLSYIKKHDFTFFGQYRIYLGILLICIAAFNLFH